jgi:uncharacterized protein
MKEYTAEKLIAKYGSDILASPGMIASKKFMQHGGTSVYAHSVLVAHMCVKLSRLFRIKVDHASLIRGALLHDYFLYDWHSREPGHRWHGFTHAGQALKNAEADFKLSQIERNMIVSHMFPMNLTLPKYRESILLCIADKICALTETFTGGRKVKA